MIYRNLKNVTKQLNRAADFSGTANILKIA